MDLTLDARSIGATSLSELLLAVILGRAHRHARHLPGLASWMRGCVAVSLALGRSA